MGSAVVVIATGGLIFGTLWLVGAVLAVFWPDDFDMGRDDHG